MEPSFQMLLSLSSKSWTDLYNPFTSCWGVSHGLESTYIPMNLGKKDVFVSHLHIFVILYTYIRWWWCASPRGHRCIHEGASLCWCGWGRRNRGKTRWMKIWLIFTNNFKTTYRYIVRPDEMIYLYYNRSELNRWIHLLMLHQMIYKKLTKDS